MIKCQNCGAQMPDGIKFCQECGKPLEQKKNVCPKCNIELPDNSKFCSECGFQVEQSQTPAMSGTQASYREPQKTTGLQKFKSILLSIAIIAAPVLFIIFVSIVINEIHGRQNDRKKLYLEDKKRYEGNPKMLEDIERWNKEYEIDMTKGKIIISLWVIGGIVSIIISTKLIIKGQRENNRKKILIAGFLYFICIHAGIPSAVICFIAFAIMKKT